MSNLLVNYQDIVETYLIGLRTQLNTNFRFHIDLEEGSVIFKRDVPSLPEYRVLAIRYIFDKETLECEKLSAEMLKICLWDLKNTLTDCIFKFSDEFYQDRLDGKLLTSDATMDVLDKDGKYKTIRVDSVDYWKKFFLAE